MSSTVTFFKCDSCHKSSIINSEIIVDSKVSKIENEDKNSVVYN